jgi:hypothetical protein
MKIETQRLLPGEWVVVVGVNELTCTDLSFIRIIYYEQKRITVCERMRRNLK